VLRGDARETGTVDVNAQPMGWCNVERSSPLVAGHDKVYCHECLFNGKQGKGYGLRTSSSPIISNDPGQKRRGYSEQLKRGGKKIRLTVRRAA
jgi:hypothetical protein